MIEMDGIMWGESVSTLFIARTHSEEVIKIKVMFSCERWMLQGEQVRMKLPVSSLIMSQTSFCLFSLERASRITAQTSRHLPWRTIHWLTSHNALCQGTGQWIGWSHDLASALSLFHPPPPPPMHKHAPQITGSSGAKVVLNHMCTDN